MAFGLTAGEMAQMRVVNEALMQDEIVHVPAVSGEDSVGEDTTTYPADGETYECGIDPSGGQEQARFVGGNRASQVQTITAEALMRLSLDTEGIIGAHDRVRWTKRYGVALLSPLTFEVVGLPEMGPSGMVFKLMLVTT